MGTERSGRRKPSKLPKDLITQAEYARRKGKSRQAISKLVKKGVIPTHDGRINEAEADEAVKKHLAPLSDMTYAQARTEHERYKAGLAKLEFEEKSGKLHDTDACRKEAFSEGRKIRDAMLGIPDRISSILAAETDEARVNALLKQEIRAALDDHVSG